MRLQSLRLHGFKSFADRTTLDFRDGVTAIIGSNGCGKSNIADAIRWVLGEQRASAVRGSKMEEVIFQGTARRRPLNFAEVSLVFDNQSGRVPIPQTEIDVSRKVFREGGSEYSLNRNACRLRDVQSLLRDTGLGSNAYAIIEATMIETLLSDKAEERRTLFEEAAGIGKYKDSRHAATRRLEAAEADLTRLEDLIAEVESKVRTLGKQKRKAEKHRELQARRLDLEIAVAREELDRLEAGLRVAEVRRGELDEQERLAAADRSTSEAVLEERRIEATELGRQRTQISAQLASVRAELDAREREVLVADERRSNAGLRMKQLVEERASIDNRLKGLAQEIEQARAAREKLQKEVHAAKTKAGEKAEQNQEIRRALASERAKADEAASRSRELAREIAAAEGERAAAERRRRDALDRATEITTQLEQVRLDLSATSDQTELWDAQAEDVRELVARAGEAVDQARETLTVLRGREQRAREEARAVDDRVSTLTAQLDAREAVERGYEGFSPAVTAIMAAKARFPGVRGPLADFLSDSTDRSQAVEGYLGPLLQALVIEDLATARSIRKWFREEWTEGGSILLLPLEALPSVSGSVNAEATPSQWVDLLLADFVADSSDPLATLDRSAVRAGPMGETVDKRGVIRLARAEEGQGILGRREALGRLRAEVAEGIRLRDQRGEELERLRESLREAEERSVHAAEAARMAESRLKGLELDAAAHRDRRGRLLRDRDGLEASLAGHTQSAEEGAEQLEKLGLRLKSLADAVRQGAQNEELARGRLAELERLWDVARDEDSEFRVSLARLESDLREVERRLGAAENSHGGASARFRGIEREAEEIRQTLDKLSGVRERAAEDIQRLFEARDRETARVTLLDARLAEVDSELAELGERARVARRHEVEATEERHRLDLQISEGRSRIDRYRERLEAEWGRPWTALVASAVPQEEGDPESWRRELRQTIEQLEAMGPVNMLAVEEHAEEDRRLEFLLTQRKDLVEARDNLTAAIRQINRTAREVFQGTFEAVRANFQRTFQSLFQGGECNIWLTDPDDPLESAVEIQASPVGKKTQRIHLLSGGERTLTALALLFALYLVKPSPFCVLDEVDAPLDESNVGRFIHLLRDFKHETQFIVITHNPRTMEAADWVYGVTMEEPGISSIVGVELLGAFPQQERPVAGTAQ